MSNLIYQAVCNTENCFIGAQTSNHQQAFQDEQTHLQSNPTHDVDIQITQTFAMSGQSIPAQQPTAFEGS